MRILSAQNINLVAAVVQSFQRERRIGLPQLY
jgi:hypothetical protein